MKSFVAVLIILFIIIALAIANALYVANVFSRLSELSKEVIGGSGDDGVANILSLWQKNEALLSLSIEADELERMNDLIESLKLASEIDNTYELRKYCRLISELSDELMNYERLSLQSIF